FKGTPEMVESFFRGLADDVRRELSEVGIQSIEKLVGRNELLFQNPDVKLPRGVSVDLSQLVQSDIKMRARSRTIGGSVEIADSDASSLTTAIDQVCKPAIYEKAQVKASFVIRNTDRAIGARLSGKIARVYGDAGLADGTIELNFRGCAGQSFGAFNIHG